MDSGMFSLWLLSRISDGCSTVILLWGIVIFGAVLTVAVLSWALLTDYQEDREIERLERLYDCGCEDCE